MHAGGRPELKQLLEAATGGAGGAEQRQVDSATKATGQERGKKAAQHSKSAAGRAVNEALQALMGPLMASRGLRYKKKMWSFRVAGARQCSTARYPQIEIIEIC